MSFRVRDPVHNFVEIPDDLVKIVDSSALQRLRGIRQLAMASLVYPGAIHTRFDHTLGVTHVASLMATALGLNPEEQRMVQLAGLLHDIGHGPFSHVSEASLSRFADRSSLKSDQKSHKIHELVTAQIIRSNETLCRHVPETDREHVIELLGPNGYGRPVLKQIVSGPLDADKQDYLLRDGQFCGVEYGTFDLQQMHRSFVLVGDGGDEELLITENGVHAVEQFALAKYYMTANVYRHRVRLIADQMIGRAIQLGIERDRLELLKQLYTFDNSDTFAQNYQQWDDARFMEVFAPIHSTPPGEWSGKILRRLRERRLLKRVYSERVEELNARVRDLVLKELVKPARDEIRRSIEREVAEHLAKVLKTDVSSELVIAHVFSIKSARESSRNEEAEILVQKGDSPRLFSEESKLFGSINEAYTDSFVELYAPIEWPDPSQKNVWREDQREAIREMIEKHCLASRRKN